MSGASGIDDQLRAHWSELGAASGADGVNGHLRQSIASGALLLAVVVTDLNSYVNDSALSLSLRLVRARAGLAPDPTCASYADAASCAGERGSVCSWSASLAICSGIAPNQTFDTVMELGTMAGAIQAGRLVADGDVTLPLPVSGGAVLPLRHLHLDVERITPATLVHGQLGGTLLVDDVVARWGMDLGLDRAAVESTFMPDLEPDPTGAHCAGISVGLGFGAVAATVR